MKTHKLGVALSVVVCCFAYQLEYSSRAINAYKEFLADWVFPLFIGCDVGVNIYYLVRRMLPTMPRLSTDIFYLVRRMLPKMPGRGAWPANIEIYIGTAIDVLACYFSLLRINLSYLCLAIFPLMAIFFIFELCRRLNRLSRRGDVKSKSSTTGADNGMKVPRINILYPHFVLCMFGMRGDPDRNGNNYDISILFLFLTCILLHLTLMMKRLPAGISRGIKPASDLLYKASLVMGLLTVHVMVANHLGKRVALTLLLEVVPLLLWLSIHLERSTPIISIQEIKNSELIVLSPVVVAIFWYILVLSNDESWFETIGWACYSCATSAVLTHVIAIMLSLWPEKVGIATLSYDEAQELLKFWVGSVMLKPFVCLLACCVVALLCG